MAGKNREGGARDVETEFRFLPWSLTGWKSCVMQDGKGDISEGKDIVG